MHFPKPISVPLGIAAGLACTAGISTLATLSASTPWPWHSAPADWGQDMYPIFRELMRVSYHPEGFVAPIAPGEFAIVLCNHPSTFGNSQLCYYLGQHITRAYSTVTKHDLEWILRAPLNTLGLSVPINRADRPAAIRSVSLAIPKLAKRGGALLLFPDGTRPTAAKRKDARSKWIKRIPDFDSWSTLPPRSGALHTVLQSLDRPVRIFNLTQAFSVVDESWSDLPNLFGARYHIKAEEFMSDQLPHDETSLQAWQIIDGRAKNRDIAAWRKV